MMMATGYCIQSFPGEDWLLRKPRTLELGERPAGAWYHGLTGFSEKFSRKDAKEQSFFLAVFASLRLCVKNTRETQLIVICGAVSAGRLTVVVPLANVTCIGTSPAPASDAGNVNCMKSKPAILRFGLTRTI